MKQIIFFVCLLTVVGVSASATDFYPQDKALSIIQKTLKNNSLEITGSISLSEGSEVGQRMMAYRFREVGKQDILYAVFTESKGRYDLFDYLVIMNNTAIVQKVVVIKYRSEHGGEIASKKWLSQFENYSGKFLQYGEDISAISGATLSAGSITRDMQKVVLALKKQLESGEI